MKRLIIPIIMICLAFTMNSCGNSTDKTFTGTVIDNNGSLMVKPDEGTDEIRSSDKIAVYTIDAKLMNSSGDKITVSDIRVNQKVQVTYNGMIMESYPAQITASKVKVLE